MYLSNSRGCVTWLNVKIMLLDRSAAGIDADTDVFANLFDLRLQIAFAHNIAGLVERDLAPDDDPMTTTASPA